MANSPRNIDAVVEVALNGGIDINSLDKPGMTWVQNAIFRANRFETRGGFGTIAQFGTTMNGGRDTENTYGYGQPISATLQITDQDHVQILSIHPLVANTGTLTGQNLNSLFALSVFDVTTGRRMEHVFRNQTQWVSNLPNAFLQSTSQPNWIETQGVNAPPSFAQLADLQYMAIPGQGVWFYRPVDPYTVSQQIQTVPGTIQNGDSSWLERLVPVDGIFLDAGNTYFNATTFPQPACLCGYQNRMVYASGRKLYFSDVDRPDNILANSFFQVPTELPITAIASVKGVILAFTAEETWLYQPDSPTQTGLISGGNVYNLSRSIGCLSPNSLTLMGDTIVFVDRRGIYTTSGGTDITKISGPIDPWFSLPEQIQNPLTNFITSGGIANDFGAQQPRAWIDFTSQLPEATLAWDAQNQLLYITLLDLSLVYTPNAGWSVYLYETTAVNQRGNPPETVVGVQQNIHNPIILVHGGNTYMIGGPEEEAYDQTGTISRDTVDSSVYILQMGRGGSLDRSSVTQEDLRQPYQAWESFVALPTTKPTFYVAPPILLPKDFETTHQGIGSRPTWLVPIYVAGNTAPTAAFSKDVESLILRLRFDKTLWRPLLIAPGAPSYDYIIPPNRLKSAPAYQDMKLYTGGVTDPAGDIIHIEWGSLGVPNTWSAYPRMIVNPGVPQPFCYLLMERKSVFPLPSSFSMVWRVIQAKMGQRGSPVDANVIICQETGQPSYTTQDLDNNTHAQPVDWAISTPLVGDGKRQYKARGTYTTLQSYGKATQEQVPKWILGPVNTLTAADYNDFSAQKQDWVDPANMTDPLGLNGNPSEITNIGTPRFRMGDHTNGIGDPSAKVGGDPNVLWATAANPDAGNLLIDDPAVDTIATSEGVRGERFRTMLFGCLNDNGEQVKIQRVRILTRITGGLRHTGRRGII